MSGAQCLRHSLDGRGTIIYLKENQDERNYKSIVYRPFDNRITYFSGKSKGFFAYSQNRIMKNMKI
jgi:hypothetical protein